MSTTRTTQLYIHRESIPLSCSESQLLLHCQRWAQTLGANIQLMYEYIFNPGGKEQIRIVQTNIHLQMYSLDLSLSQIKCQTHLLISSFKQLVSTSCQHLVTWLGQEGCPMDLFSTDHCTPLSYNCMYCIAQMSPLVSCLIYRNYRSNCSSLAIRHTFSHIQMKQIFLTIFENLHLFCSLKTVR